MPTTDLRLERFLDELGARYDADQRMTLKPAQTPGYHTRIADGSMVHATVEAMDYALALLLGGAAAASRASQ